MGGSWLGWLCPWLCIVQSLSSASMGLVVMVINRLVRVLGEEWCYEVGQVSDDGGFDVVDVTGFVSVYLLQGVCHFFQGDMAELKLRERGWCWWNWLGSGIRSWWYCCCVGYGLAGSVTNCDEMIVQCCGDVYWVCEGSSVMCCDGSRGGSVSSFGWDD